MGRGGRGPSSADRPRAHGRRRVHDQRKGNGSSGGGGLARRGAAAQGAVDALGADRAGVAAAVEHRQPIVVDASEHRERLPQARPEGDGHPRRHHPATTDDADQTAALADDDGPVGGGVRVLTLRHGRRVLEVAGSEHGDAHPPDPAVRPNEGGDLLVGGGGEQGGRVGILLELAGRPEHGDAVTEAGRLVDVVRHEHDGLVQLGLDAPELLLQAVPRERVDRAERLVHEENGRVRGQRPGHPDALLLPAGQLVGVAPRVGARLETDHVEQLGDAAADALAVPAEQRRHGRDVLLDRAMREEPDPLDDVPHAAAQLLGVAARDVAAVEPDPAGGRLDEPVDEPQRRRFTAAGRADEHDHLAAADVERHLVDGHCAVRVPLPQPVEPDHRLGGRFGPVIRGAIGSALIDSHAPTVADDCLLRNAWVCPEYVRTRAGDLAAASATHLRITLVSVVIGAVIALPLALLARRIRGLRAPVLGLSTAIYTIPSLALFSLLLPFTGLSQKTVVIGLVLYTLTILVRAVLAGLDGVPEEVRDAGRGMGYSERGLLWRVELPLALPVLIGGLRIATVSTVALTTIGTIVGYGGLGDLITTGLRSNFKAQVLTASVLCVVLALVLDVLLVGVQRLLMPWRREA